MRWTHRPAAVLRSLFLRPRVERELGAELRFHLTSRPPSTSPRA